MWAVRGGLLIHSEGAYVGCERGFIDPQWSVRGPMWAVRGGLLIHSEGAYVGCESGFIDPQ